HHRGGLQVASTMEVRRVIDAALAVINRVLRIRAQRSRATTRRSGAAPRGKQRRGWNALLHPFDQCSERIYRRRSCAAAAVPDTRRAKQPIEALQVLEVRLVVIAVPRSHLAVVLDDATRIDKLVIATDERQQFASACPKNIQRSEGVRNVGDVARAIL